MPYETALETYREQLGELAKGGPDVAVGEMLIRISDTLASIDAAAELGSAGVGRALSPSRRRRAIPGHPRQARRRRPLRRDASGRDRRHQGPGRCGGVRDAHAGRYYTGPGAGDSQAELVGYFRRLRALPTRTPARTRGRTCWIRSSTWSTPRGGSEQGARIIGGCCGTRPDHIRALSEWLRGG